MKSSAFFFVLGTALLSCAALAAPKPAQKAVAGAGGGETFLLATFGDWSAYSSGKDKAKVCYALSQPKDRKPAGLNRDPAYIFISNRLADGSRNELSVILGFPTKAGSEATASIGSASFAMLTKDKNAWLKNPAQETQMIDAMKKGSDLTVKATSGRGNELTDRYSLRGLGDALARVAKECP